MTTLRNSRFAWLLRLLLVAPLLAGCSRAPSVEIVGSFFPAWLLCFFVATVLTALVHLALLRLRTKVALPMIIYPSLAAVFTFLLWLVFFS